MDRVGDRASKGQTVGMNGTGFRAVSLARIEARDGMWLPRLV